MKGFISLSLILITLIISCKGQESVKISIENESDVDIDSIKFVMQNFQMTMPDLKAHTTNVFKVSTDTIQTNNHDVIIHIMTFDKANIKFSGGFDYSDLSGRLPSIVRIRFTKDLKIKILRSY